MDADGATESHDVVQQLRQLGDLRAAGALSDDEFVRAKARLLQREPEHRAAPAPEPATAWVVPSPPVAGPPVLPSPPGSGPPVPWPGPSGVRSAAGGVPLDSPPRRTADLAGEGWQATVHRSAIGAGVGGLVTLVAFLAMPMATLPVLGSITGVGLAGEASNEGTLGLLWLIPVAAVAVLALAAWLRWGADLEPGVQRTTSIAVAAAAAVALTVLIVGAARLQAVLDGSGASRIGVNAANILAAGFWFGLLGMIVAVLAGGVALVVLGPVVAARRESEGGR